MDSDWTVMETFSAVTNGESIFLLELANHAPDDSPVVVRYTFLSNGLVVWRKWSTSLYGWIVRVSCTIPTCRGILCDRILRVLSCTYYENQIL